MFKSFCDGCGKECDPKNSGSRRFAILFKNRIGVEAVPLFDTKPTPDHHICDECIAELLLKAAERFADTDIIKKYYSNLRDSELWFSKRFKLDKKEQELNQKEIKVSELEVKYKKELAELEEQRKEEVITKKNEEIAVLKAAIESLKNAATAQDKIQLAQKIQAEIDAKENAEYLASTQKRERMRASG